MCPWQLRICLAGRSRHWDWQRKIKILHLHSLVKQTILLAQNLGYAPCVSYFVMANNKYDFLNSQLDLVQVAITQILNNLKKNLFLCEVKKSKFV